MIDILHIPLDESGHGWEDFAAQLPEDEQQRTQRFHFEADRLRFAKCRAILRRELARRLSAEAAMIALRFGEHGKPFVDGDTDLQFNLSHTRGAALLAFGRGAELGVDIEVRERRADLDGVANKVYTERERALLAEASEDDKRRLWFALWTAKEAFLKATGRGLSLDPSLIEAHIAESGRITFECNAEVRASRLIGRIIELESPFSAAICAPGAHLPTTPAPTPSEG